MNTTPYMASLLRRHRRLSIDYQDLTQTWLSSHRDRTNWATKAVSGCFTALRRQFLTHYFYSPPRWRVGIRRLIKDRALPDFCIIGPGKSGTSDLAVTIMSHPNVLHPLVKELGTDPLAWRPFFPTTKAVRRHARRYGVALCAFVAPCLHSLDLPTILSSLRPDTKIVINLRNPVNLVFSEWKWIVLHRDKNFVDKVPFLATFPAYIDKALEVFPEAPMPFSFGLHWGIYTTSVAYWLGAFSERNVCIFDIAEYFNDRESFFERLEQFLGLPQISLPPGLPVANRNPLADLTADPVTTAKLQQFFEPHNLRLWDVIGKKFPW